MPALPPPVVSLLTNSLISRDPAAELAANATADALEVVCAWPVSGQYGPGSRVLYYVLVIACLVARKVEWLKKACLAAALLLPAIAALHGIALAALHVDSAVDMDIYGAFQLCSIGILAAPVTVKLSSTYFNDRGRNLIFVWTGLILAGLLSLTVEFYRIQTRPCTRDNDGNPLTRGNPGAFPYGNAECNLICKPDNPYSPMRDGSLNDIFVIPAPSVLTFGTATLLAAACCIPAVLSLFSMWNKIAEFNWRQRFLRKDPNDNLDETIEGTNGATGRQMKIVNEQIMRYLKIAIEIPVFGAAVLAIVILGEKNFFSDQVDYQTEPASSIGQWGPIVGTGLAALGSLYVLLARAADEDASSESSEHECKCNHQHHEGLFVPPNTGDSPRRGRSPARPSNESHNRPSLRGQLDLTQVITGRSHATDAGKRRAVAGVMTRMSDYIWTPSKKRFDYSEFQRGPAQNYPEIPGERARNRDLSQLRTEWLAPSIREGSPDSRRSSDDSGPRAATPQTPTIKWPDKPARAARASTLPSGRPAALQTQSSPSAGALRVGRRRDTLEVPSPTYGARVRESLSIPTTPTVAVAASQASPAIVVSPEPENSTTHEQDRSGPSSSGSQPPPSPVREEPSFFSER